MSDQWLDGFLTMNGTADAQRPAAVAMLKNIHYPIAAASIVENGKMVACGLGVAERGYVGLYDIYVDASCRRRGLGADICTAIMQAGKAQGCKNAYLQVLADNTGARSLYRQLGYTETYEYWFRIKRL
jgi:ribosomal protein S18 acetylase RimI-like enzyme